MEGAEAEGQVDRSTTLRCRPTIRGRSTSKSLPSRHHPQYLSLSSCSPCHQLNWLSHRTHKCWPPLMPQLAKSFLSKFTRPSPISSCNLDPSLVGWTTQASGPSSTQPLPSPPGISTSLHSLQRHSPTQLPPCMPPMTTLLSPSAGLSSKTGNPLPPN
jgi:hypothetical protein